MVYTRRFFFYSLEGIPPPADNLVIVWEACGPGGWLTNPGDKPFFLDSLSYDRG